MSNFIVEFANVDYWGKCSVKLDDKSILGIIKSKVMQAALDAKIISKVDRRNATPHVAITNDDNPKNQAVLDKFRTTRLVINRSSFVLKDKTIEITMGSNEILDEIHFTVIFAAKLEKKFSKEINDIIDKVWMELTNLRDVVEEPGVEGEVKAIPIPILEVKANPLDRAVFEGPKKSVIKKPKVRFPLEVEHPNIDLDQIRWMPDPHYQHRPSDIQRAIISFIPIITMIIGLMIGYALK